MLLLCLEIIVEIDVRDAVFLEQLNIIVRQAKVGKTVLERLGKILGIDCWLGGADDKQKLGAMFSQGVNKCQCLLNILLDIGLGVIHGAVSRLQ